MILDKISLPNLNKISDKRVMLGAVFCLLAIIHFLSLWRSAQPIESSIVLLIFYGSAFYFYYSNPKKLRFSNHLIPQVLGGVLSCLIAFKIFSLYQSEVKVAWALIAPLMMLSLVLLADGFSGIKHYWKLLFGITWISSISPGAEELTAKYDIINEVSAQTASFILWYFGFNSKVESTFIYVNGGAVDVYSGCTALPFLILFINLLMILWLFHPSLIQNFFFYLIASLVISFPLSVIRIAVMALVVNDKEAFAYWHGTSGSNFFMIIALACFWGVIFWKDSGNLTDDPSDQIIEDLREKKSQVSWGITIFSVSLILIFSYILFSPYGGANKITAYQFPANINLPGWDLVGSEALAPNQVNISEAAMDARKSQDSPLSSEDFLAIRAAQNGSDIVMDGRRYFYKNAEAELTATLRYVINTFGNLGLYYGDDQPDLEMSKIFRQSQRQVSPTKETLKFTDNNRTFLASCITPFGKAVTRHGDFAHQRNNNLKNTILNPLKLADWFMGKTMFFDHRCLWMELAIEPNSTANSQLDSVWPELKAYGRKNFPRP